MTGKQNATQNSKNVETNYTSDDDNTILGPRGVGITMNMYDNATNHQMTLDVYFLTNPGTIYATYQHARHSNVTLAMAQSYTFSASGLGKVLLFSNATITGYYDGMTGVEDSTPYPVNA